MPTVQNKANLAGHAGWDGATGTWDERQTCKTNPIPERRPTGRGGAGCANKPNSYRRADQEIGVPGGQTCKTKPIPRLRIADFGLRIQAGLRPVALGPRGPVVQTKPIGRRQSCKTNPISGRSPVGRGHRGGGRGGQMCKTNPISPAGPDSCPSPLDPPASPPPSQLCETKPILPGAAERTSTLGKKSYDGLGLPRR